MLLVAAVASPSGVSRSFLRERRARDTQLARALQRLQHDESSGSERPAESRFVGLERESPGRFSMPTKRTTHRSTAGKKLYAVRDEQGRFEDIQTYERAHRADLAKKSKAEIEADKAKPKP
jgi:hypothetical protein